MKTPPPINEEEIAQVAAALPLGERAAYLDAACAGHPEVRARLDSLLFERDAAEFLRGAAAPVSPELEAQLARLKPEQAGERIGPYKLLQQIGEGGFGTVWMAEQTEPVKRRVALKIIKLGMDTKEVIARFEQERQALAMMDHPNIAKVFDAGATQWGRPFFVMELVRGVPITEYCDEQKLPVPKRLALFIDVCHALQHAHQKGIIHRDLKPSNILISAGDDHEPVPKIIDFGVAKAMDRTLTDKTLFTQFEQMIGTPAYMSPEQAGVGPMDIDTRSDIYSLGVLLYEMLTGKPPFDPNDLRKAGHDEMRRVIREQEPPKPSTRLSTLKEMDLTAVATHRRVEAAKLTSMLRGDLDWIVMKALEKDRNRRYETANGLAMDIRRHLGCEPVLAAGPTAGYKFRKFARRNKVALSVAGLIAVVLIAATCVSTWQWRTARLAEARATDLLHRFQSVEIDENMKLGDYPKALPLIDEALKAGHPDRDNLFFQRIEALEALNDPAFALLTKTLDPATFSPAQRPRLDFWNADRLLRSGDVETAISLLARAIEQRLPPVEEELARAAMCENVTAALEHYYRAAELAPRRSMVRRNLTLATLLSGRVEEARVHIRSCQILFPREGGYYILESLLEAFQGNGERARAAAARIPDEEAEARSFFLSAAGPLAAFSSDVIRALCGTGPKISMADQFILRRSLDRFHDSSGGEAVFPGLPGTPPPLSRGMDGLLQALQQNKDRRTSEAAAELRSALQSCDEGTLWSLLGCIEWHAGRHLEAREALRKAQTTPSLFAGAADAARLLEGANEASIWMGERNKSDAMLEPAAAAFRDAYKSKLPLNQVHEMALMVALKTGDMYLANQVAEAMPRDSAAQLNAMARIEYADGNHGKALKISEKAIRLFPEDGSLKELHDRIQSGTLNLPRPDSPTVP